MNWFILGFSLLMAALCFYYGIKLGRLHARVRQWARAQAQITQKSVGTFRSSGSGRANHTIKASYGFSVNGINHTGDKVFLVQLIGGNKGFTKPAAERFLAKIPNEIEIYYNPQNPGESVMYCDGRSMYILVFLFGFLSLLLGLAQFAG